MKVDGTKEFDASRDRVWAVISDPAGMAGLMPGVEGFEVIDDTHWRAKVKVPLGLGGIKMTMEFEQLEERPLEFASMRGKGKGMGAMMDMTTSFTLSGEGDHTHMAWEADVNLAGVLASMGQRVLQPMINQQVEAIMTALEKQLEGAGMTVPFRVGVMQLTMEPLEEMLESARVMDEAGLDTIWLAEAYPWWRKHGMEAKSSTVLAGIIARETKRLTVGWGIISPYTRHPVQVAMDARLVQEAAGPGRFIAGFGTSKIFLNNTKQGGPPKVTKPLATMRDSVEILRGILGGERFEYDGKVFSADIPALSPDAHVPRWNVPVYVAGTAPLMQQLGGEIGDGLLTPSITTPDFVRYTLGNVRIGAEKSGRDPASVDVGCTVVASIHATRSRRGP